MSKFNSKRATNKTVTHEGGEAYKKTSSDYWFNMLFSSYVEDKFYESSYSQLSQFLEETDAMIETYGAEFVAKAAIFARKELGMRSISHILAGVLNNHQFTNKRAFFRNFANRPDDVSEVFACIDMYGDKRSHAAIRGFGDYLSTLSSYTLGKYKMNGHKYNMYDLINLTHAHSNAIQDYKDDNLSSPDTWEVKISTAENDAERSFEWRRLVEENKLGYIALLRNLRNILNADIDEEWIETYLVPQLTNQTAIEKSLVFPYQIYTAYKYLDIKNTIVVTALSKAFRYSCDNMPLFDDKTAIILDVSGSMTDPISRNSRVTIKEVGACFAASLLISGQNDMIFIKFGNRAKTQTFNKLDNPFTIISKMCDNGGLGCGTEIDKAFNCLENTYTKVDRIFLISDMQTMTHCVRYYSGPLGWDVFDRYQQNTGTQPKLFSFDLGNYDSQIGNPKYPNVHLMTALNDKIFKIIKLLDCGIPIEYFVNETVSDDYQC